MIKNFVHRLTVSNPVLSKARDGTVINLNNDSLYEKLRCYSKVQNVDGIWRAPRTLNFTKDEFDRSYPEDYKGMRIGLPNSGTFAAKYIDPKFDEISPLLWTTVFITPYIIWAAVEFILHKYQPKREHH